MTSQMRLKNTLSPTIEGMATKPQVTISVNQAALNRIIMVVKSRLESMFLSASDHLPHRTSAFTNLGDRIDIFSFVDAALNMFTGRPNLGRSVTTVHGNEELRALVAALLPNTAAVQRLVFSAQVEEVIEKEVKQLAHVSDVMLSDESYSPYLFLVSVDDNTTFIDILIRRIKTNFLRYYRELLEDYRSEISKLRDGNHRPGAPRLPITPDILPADLVDLTQQLEFDSA